MDKLEAVNAVLNEMTPGTWVERTNRGWMVSWRRGDKVLTRRWCTQVGSSFYPAWHRQWAHGGTCCTALAQLMRWLQNRPVMPIGTWHYWSGESIRLGTPKMIKILESAGYPVTATCIACGESISSGLDWWHLGKVSGPCHTFATCRDSSKTG